MKCSLFLIILLLTLPVSAQIQQPRLISDVDLRKLGVQAPPAGWISRSRIEILFLSNSRLLLLNSPRFPSDNLTGMQLSSIDAASGAILRTVPLASNEWGDVRQWSQLQRVSNAEFAIAYSTGIMFCNADLECKQGPNLVGPFRFAPDGNHFVIGPPLPAKQNGEQWTEFDRDANKLGSYPEDSHTQMLAGNHGTFFASPSGLRYYSTGQPSAIAIRSDVSPVSLSLANVGIDSVAYLTGKSHQLAVVSTAGIEPYQVDLDAFPKLAWDTHLVSSADGKRFGAEWTANTKLQLLKPFACIDECPAPALQYFLVFSSADGKLVHSFEWDPRPWNLYVIPALSPDGTVAAMVQGVSLKIYALK